MSTRAEKTSDAVIKVLHYYGYTAESSETKHLLYLLTISHFKTTALKQDLTNEALAHSLLIEFITAIEANFGITTTRRILREIFLKLAKLLDQKKISWD
jgi:hypothetical protein